MIGLREPQRAAAAFLAAAAGVLALPCLAANVVRADTPTVAAAAPRYEVIDLGVLPTLADDIWPGLNERGEVSAWAFAANDRLSATLWSDGKVTDLGPLPDFRNTYAAGLNTEGLVVGIAKSPDDLRPSRAFAWQTGKMRDLGTLGGKYARARAVNESGEIVGEAQTADGAFHAFRWRQGALEDLGTIGKGEFSVAHAINRVGVVVGVGALVPNGKNHALLWENGAVTPAKDLGLLPGGSLSNARAINNKNEVVGWADLHDGELHPFLWRQGRLTDLGTLATEPSVAWAINNQSEIVGSSQINATQMHAFLWTGGVLRDLNTLIPAQSGWILRVAFRINDRGQILGKGSIRRESHLFLLNPVARTVKTVNTENEGRPRG